MVYPFNNTTTPLRTYNNTYLTASNYTSYFVFNLLSTSVLMTGGNNIAELLNGTTTPMQVDAATNRLLYASYDANGNMTSGAGATFTYDEANRVTTVTETSGGEAFYGYDASIRRIYQRAPLSPTWSVSTEAFIFYGVRGENVGRYAIISDPYWGFSFQPWVTNLYFGRRLVAQTGSSYPPAVRQDRLGTNRSTGNYYPFGDGAAGTDNFQFATYTRDSYTGIDDADQRYYASTYGRFLTADPKGQKAAKLTDSSSWNLYAYTRGDPVNRFDPRGTCDQTTYSTKPDGTIVVDCADYPNWESRWGALPGGFSESLFGPGYSNTNQCFVCLMGVTDTAFGDQDYANQVVQSVNRLNAGGFLNAFMGYSALAGAGGTAFAADAAAFMDGVAYARTLLLEPGGYVSQATGLFYSGYLETGAIVGAETMGVPNDVWEAMSTGQRQAMLTGGILKAIQSGMQVVFTVSPTDATGFTTFEYQFVTQTLGSSVAQQGTSWVVQGTLPPQFLAP